MWSLCCGAETNNQHFAKLSNYSMRVSACTLLHISKLGRRFFMASHLSLGHCECVNCLGCQAEWAGETEKDEILCNWCQDVSVWFFVSFRFAEFSLLRIINISSISFGGLFRSNGFSNEKKRRFCCCCCGYGRSCCCCCRQFPPIFCLLLFLLALDLFSAFSVALEMAARWYLYINMQRILGELQDFQVFMQKKYIEKLLVLFVYYHIVMCPVRVCECFC